MSDPYIAAQIRADLLNAQNERNGGPDYERGMKRYAEKYRDAEKKLQELREAVKPVIEALANLTDTDDFRGVGKALVRCHSLLDKFPDLAPQNDEVARTEGEKKS